MQTQANMKTNLWECYYGSISSLSISPKKHIFTLMFCRLKYHVPTAGHGAAKRTLSILIRLITPWQSSTMYTPLEMSHQAEGVLYAPQGLCRKSRDSAAVAWIVAGAQCSFFTSVALGSSEEICRICESLTLSNVQWRISTVFSVIFNWYFHACVFSELKNMEVCF